MASTKETAEIFMGMACIITELDFHGMDYPTSLILQFIKEEIAE